MKNTKLISATIDKEVLKKAKELAKEERRSFSQMISILIESGIKHFKNK